MKTPPRRQMRASSTLPSWRSLWTRSRSLRTPRVRFSLRRQAEPPAWSDHWLPGGWVAGIEPRGRSNRPPSLLTGARKCLISRSFRSGRLDLNRRPLGPSRVRYSPIVGPLRSEPAPLCGVRFSELPSLSLKLEPWPRPKRFRPRRRVRSALRPVPTADSRCRAESSRCPRGRATPGAPRTAPPQPRAGSRRCGAGVIAGSCPTPASLLCPVVHRMRRNKVTPPPDSC